jgi:teichuronic acid biosynthesis glycosyltransferase TuaG
MPEVSIITPCYNSAIFLEETIQSVLNQKFKNWEWLITDDHSSS